MKQATLASFWILILGAVEETNSIKPTWLLFREFKNSGISFWGFIFLLSSFGALLSSFFYFSFSILSSFLAFFFSSFLGSSFFGSSFFFSSFFSSSFFFSSFLGSSFFFSSFFGSSFFTFLGSSFFYSCWGCSFLTDSDFLIFSSLFLADSCFLGVSFTFSSDFFSSFFGYS